VNIQRKGGVFKERHYRQFKLLLEHWILNSISENEDNVDSIFLQQSLIPISARLSLTDFFGLGSTPRSKERVAVFGM
jgi:hypothetical protein